MYGIRSWGLIAALLWAGMILASDEVDIRLEDSGRIVSLMAPGLTAFRGNFSATLSANGKQKVLSSVHGVSTDPVEHVTETTPYGVAELTATTICPLF